MRVSIPSANTNIAGQRGSKLIYHSRGRRLTIKIQTFGAVNVFVSKIQDELIADTTGVSQNGLLLPQNTITEFRDFSGELYGMCDQSTVVEVFEC